MDFDWKGTLGKVAPGIANTLGGPLAGMATQAICGALGLQPGSTEADISTAIQNLTPEGALALKKADNDFAVQMKKLDVDIYKVDAADRASARDMRLKSGAFITNTLACIIVVGWILINYALFTATAELPNKEVLLRTMGTMDGALLLILYFFYGSSAGSKRKTEIDSKRRS